MARYNEFQIAGFAKQAGFPDNEIATATAVALAESGGDAAATNKNTNGTYDYGMWQINTVHGGLLSQGDKFNPLDNAKMALQVWRGAGGKWTPWSVYKSGIYRTQILKGTAGAAKPEMPSTSWQPPLVTPEGEPIPYDPNMGGAAVPTNPVTQGLTDLYNTVKSFNDTVTSLVTTLFSGGFWLRIGAFVVGALLVAVSLIKLTGAEKMIPMVIPV